MAFHYKGDKGYTPSPKLDRPDPRPDWYTKDITFQLMEAKQYRTEPLPGMPGPQAPKVKEVTAIWLFGVTASGVSVLAHVHGFQPYIWIQAPPGWSSNHIEPFRRMLNSRCEGALQTPEAIVSIEEHPRTSLMHYHVKRDTPFLKITTLMPGMVPRIRSILEGKGVMCGGGVEYPPLYQGPMEFMTYESNVLFELRFLVDLEIGGSNWITCPAGTYRPKPNKTSLAQLEIDIAFDKLVPHESVGEYMKIAPLRILSFDIECQGRPGKFPEAEHDSVIQIASCVHIHGNPEPLTSTVFCLKKVSPIPGVELHCFENEREMLLAWGEYFRAIDPDVVTGYNIVNFDIPYLLDRARVLNAVRFPFLSRIRDLPTTMRSRTFQNKAHGRREYQEIDMPGRVQVDLLVIMQHEHKLRSYSLNNVSQIFLGEQKEDVHHSIISDLQNGNEETRNRLARYCFKDAKLPLRLMEKLMILINLVEMARVTGVPVAWLIDKGQQIKVYSQILRKAQKCGLLFPTVESGGEQETYTGATVIEPTRGFHNYPIATLDFASLYPSIMMAHNLCYSTLLPRGAIKDSGLVKDKDYIVTPSGDCFVTKERYHGILPVILQDLLGARKAAKKAMQESKDPMEVAVYNGRQLALKISANSVYGFTGATVGKLPCLEISASVTSFGRAMIEQTKQAVESKYTVANGYKKDAKVVYGDTDSVMINFGGEDITTEEAMALGNEAAQEVTKMFPPPVKLEFEKVYFPYLLVNKKRYAGLLWTRPDKFEKLDAKGIESVRRDNCPLIANMINTVLKKILMDRSVPAAVDYVKQVISDLLMNRLDISHLVISKTLTMDKEEYAGKQAHAELAERMKKRDPGSAPSIGDRVPYVIIRGHKDAKAFEKSEDPLYVLENNLAIDSQHYLNHQLKQPILRIFEGVLPSPESELLHGEHTRQVHIPTPKGSNLMKFAKVALTCVGCRAKLSSGHEGAVCSSCKPNEAAIYARELTKRNHYEQLFSRVWTQCQRCQGSLHEDVLCTNCDCSVFYMRKKVQMDLDKAQKTLDRFGALDW